MARILSFGVLFAVHWIAQFLSWSYAERSAVGRSCWAILATPLVHLSGSLSSQYFWIITALNSALWAAVLTFRLFRLSRSHFGQDS
jgi:lipid-A-disaccharide synthase-like uncharacterized protein